MEEGEGSIVDAAEALAIENAQKAYDDALKSYNEGVDQDSELAKANEELDELLDEYSDYNYTEYIV